MPDARVRQQFEHGLDHPQTGTEHGHDHDVAGEPGTVEWLERRLNPDLRCWHVACGFSGQDKTDAMGEPPELVGRSGAVAERRQRIESDRVLHEMNRHGRELYTVHHAR